MLAAIGVFTALDWTEYRQSRDEVLAARRIFEDANSLLLSVTDAETGERGYLITGDVAYLGPYQRALEEIPAELDSLRDAATQPEDRERVDKLRSLIDTRLRSMAATVELRRKGDVDSVVRA